jgi:hypothetical protein
MTGRREASLVSFQDRIRIGRAHLTQLRTFRPVIVLANGS